MKQWLAENYGSRRGAVMTYWHRLLYLLGIYRQYRGVDWNSAGRLIFVCKGNICRSAFAEAVARSLGMESVSCGIDTSAGAPADDDAIRMAEKRGIDLRPHRTTPIQALDLRKTDLLIAMEPKQAEYLKRELGGEYVCTLLGLWGTSINPYIHDPFGASPTYFDSCFSYIENSVYEITRKIVKTNRR